MHIQYMETNALIEDGVKQLKAFFDHGQWPATITQAEFVATYATDPYSADRGTMGLACFRIIEDIECVRWKATGPEDNEEAHKLAEHWREIRNRIRSGK